MQGAEEGFNLLPQTNLLRTLKGDGGGKLIDVLRLRCRLTVSGQVRGREGSADELTLQALCSIGHHVSFHCIGLSGLCRT